MRPPWPRAPDRWRRRWAGETLAGLVNNAGIAVAGPLLHLDIDELRYQLEVNVTGQLIVTQAFAPLLGAEPGRTGPKGRIVMISSIGGTNAAPFIGPYSASKFALEGLSESLRRELMIHGIEVIIVAPGAVATPIWDKADEVDVSRYANTVYAKALDAVKRYMLELGRKGLKPEVLGEAVWKALTADKPKTRYVVTPDRIEHFMVNHLPKRHGRQHHRRTAGVEAGWRPVSPLRPWRACADAAPARACAGGCSAASPRPARHPRYRRWPVRASAA